MEHNVFGMENNPFSMLTDVCVFAEQTCCGAPGKGDRLHYLCWSLANYALHRSCHIFLENLPSDTPSRLNSIHIIHIV